MAKLSHSSQMDRRKKVGGGRESQNSARDLPGEAGEVRGGGGGQRQEEGRGGFFHTPAFVPLTPRHLLGVVSVCNVCVCLKEGV